MIDEVDLFGEKINHSASILAIRFGVPPFSVLSSREGSWQDRKRQWIALGIQSELGRAGADPFSDTIHHLKPGADKAHHIGLLRFSAMAADPNFYWKQKKAGENGGG